MQRFIIIIVGGALILFGFNIFFEAQTGESLFGVIEEATQETPAVEEPTAPPAPVPAETNPPKVEEPSPAAPAPEKPKPQPQPPVKNNRVGAALAGLDTIKVTPATRIPEYRRDEFGPAWADVDRNGCRTRDDILARDLTNVKTEDGCKVLSGVLKDPYTGKTIAFTFGQKTSSAVQIDHIVSLSGAWKGGAYTWDDNRREQFANDPANLISADGPANASKSDKGPANWMPSTAGNAAFDCEYAIRHTHVLANYGLTAPSADLKVLRKTLESCN